MTPDDLARLHAAAMAPERHWTAPEFAQLLASPGALLLGDGDAALLARLALDEAEVLTLATLPSRRRQGLAARLLAAFHREAARRGATRALLEVACDNAPARALYARAGYAEAGRRRAYYPREGGPPVDALLMDRALP